MRSYISSKYFRITKNLKKSVILGILVIALLASYLIYAATHTQTTNPAQLEFHNDLERMNYAQKTALPDEYKKHCPKIMSTSDEVACLFSAYETLLKEAKFGSWDLFYTYRARMVTLAKEIDEQTLPQSEVVALFTNEEDNYAQALEIRIRENAAIGM